MSTFTELNLYKTDKLVSVQGYTKRNVANTLKFGFKMGAVIQIQK